MGDEYSEREQLEQAIAALEAQRAILGNAAVDAALAGLQQRLQNLPGAKGPTSFEGERKLVTVMFADLSGFTALVEAMDPEAARDLLNNCFERLVPIIERYGGMVDKFIGDEVMALFGAPQAHENDPERALRAALEMSSGLEAFNAERGTALRLHFGINTGLAITGGIGPHGRQAYTVIGSTVNLAARLEEVAAQGEILVGPDTYRLAAPLFDFAALEAIAVKGLDHAVPVYRLRGARAVPGRVRGIAGLESPLVGRETELSALQAAVARLEAGQGSVVTLAGEAGLGKSRLVAEVRGAVGAMHASPLQWLEGRCLSYSTSIAYLPWLDILRQLLVVSVEDAPGAVRVALQERVRSLCPQRFGEVYPFLGRLLALSVEAEMEAEPQRLDGEQVKSSTFRAVKTLLASAARQQPLVLVCEDLHWADPTSLELLEQMLPLTGEAPLLLLCVFRPERGHRCMRLRELAAGQQHIQHTDLWLQPLAAADSAALVENLLRVEDLPPALRGRILARAEGNPFYLEEIIRALITAGDIVRDETTDRWHATRDVAEIAIPDTLQGVLTARIDRLQEDTKRVLQLASVIGRVFLYRVLAEIAREQQALDGHLSTLQQEEMIRERTRVPELEYIFKHHLTQEAAYNGLLKKERRAFHQQVAEALERLFPNRLAELVGLLAYHWEQAEQADKATDYLLRAGDQARLAYAQAEAADYYRRALRFLSAEGRHEQAARTLMTLGLVYHNAFDFRQARQAYDEAFALWQRAGEDAPTVLPPAPHALRVQWELITTLDPSLAYDTFSAGPIDQLFCGLVRLTPELSIAPALAWRWEVAEGGLKYLFHLRDDARWSDGLPITTADVVYAWQRVLDPVTGSSVASLLYDIRGARHYHRGAAGWDQVGVQALDPLTLAVELEEPVGYFLQLLVYNAAYPVPRHVVEEHGAEWTQVDKIVTSGPFRLASWQPGQSLVLVRNPQYLDRSRSRGNVHQVELHLTPEPDASYERDELDVLNIWPLPPAAQTRMRQRHPSEHITGPSLTTTFLAFNTRRPPLDDRRVRQALSMAIDRELLSEIASNGLDIPATGGLLPPAMPGYSPGIALPYDPDQARRLLAEAGYAPGGDRGFPPVTIASFRDVEATVRFVQEQWREKLGIETFWQSYEWQDLIHLLETAPPPIVYSAWIADYPDPDALLRVCPFGARSGWMNERFSTLVEEARRVAEQARRMELYRQADRILTEEAPLMPLAYGQNHLLVKPWVKRFPLSAIRWWFLDEVVLLPH